MKIIGIEFRIRKASTGEQVEVALFPLNIANAAAHAGSLASFVNHQA